jgi:WD40 repeat protein
MQTKRRRLTKSEWVILLVPFCLLALWWLNGPGRGTLRRYMPATLHLTTNTPGQRIERIEPLTFSPDSRYLAVQQIQRDSRNYIVSVWDCQTEQELWRKKFKAMTFPQFSPDGKQIGMRNPDISLADPETGEPRSVVDIYDTLTGQLQHQLPLGKGGYDFSFLPDGKHFLVNGVPFRLWNLQIGQIVKVISRRNVPYLSGARGDTKGQFIIIVEGMEVPSSSRAYMVWASTAIKVYDLSAGKTIASLAVPKDSRAYFSARADTLRIQEGNGYKVKVFSWNWRTGHRTPNQTYFDKWFQRLSLDEKTFVAVEPQRSFDGKQEKIVGYHIVCEEAQAGKVLWRVPVTSYFPPRLHFFANKKHIINSEDDKSPSKTTIGASSIVIRNAQTGVMVRAFKANGFYALSPDGRRLAVANGETVQIYDVSDLAS